MLYQPTSLTVFVGRSVKIKNNTIYFALFLVMTDTVLAHNKVKSYAFIPTKKGPDVKDFFFFSSFNIFIILSPFSMLSEKN